MSKSDFHRGGAEARRKVLQPEVTEQAEGAEKTLRLCDSAVSSGVSDSTHGCACTVTLFNQELC